MLWGPREPGAGGPRASEQRHLEKCSCNIPTTCSGGTDHRVNTRRAHSVNAVLTRGAGPRVVLKVQRCFCWGALSLHPPTMLLHVCRHSDTPAEMDALRNTHTRAHTRHAQKSHHPTDGRTYRRHPHTHSKTHTQETCTKVTLQPPQTQRHTHMETHSSVHGNRHTGYRYPETRTKRANQVCNASRRHTQRHRYLHGDAQEVHPATHTGAHPQKHTATLAEPTNRYARRRRDKQVGRAAHAGAQRRKGAPKNT